MDAETVPARVLAAEKRREFRELLSRSSLGCPLGQCEHTIGAHLSWVGYDDDGMPIEPQCGHHDCPCGAAS
jgi:hypothetical protein